MGKILKNQFSSYRSGYIGTGEPSKNVSNDQSVEPMLPRGLQGNTKVVNDLLSELSEGVRIEFQGEMRLFEILDSKKFTYGKDESDGSKITYETTYKINDAGVVAINWTFARKIQDNAWRQSIENDGGLPLSSPPNPVSPVINRILDNDEEDDDTSGVEPMLPNIR